MFADIFICGHLFLRIAGKTTKIAKITTPKISCHMVLLLAALKKNRVPLLKVTCQICTVSVNKTTNSLFAVGKVEKLAKGCFTSKKEATEKKIYKC